ncbi:MAG: hypothetical protein VW891_04480, partial [Novosphingobium sp.]
VPLHSPCHAPRRLRKLTEPDQMLTLEEQAIIATHRLACRLYARAVYEKNPPELTLESPFLDAAHAIRTAWPDIITKARYDENNHEMRQQPVDPVVVSLEDRKIERLRASILVALAMADAGGLVQVRIDLNNALIAFDDGLAKRHSAEFV